MAPRKKSKLMPEVVDALAPRPACPQGHILGAGVRCTKKRCRDAPPLAVDATLIEAMRDAAAEETRALALSGARSNAILKALGVPQGLQGAEADEWCNAKLAEMRVTALALQDYLMKHGSPSQSARAAEKVLEITERQGQIASVAPIIIINGGGGAATPPWRRTVEVGHGGQVDDVVTVQAQGSPGATEN